MTYQKLIPAILIFLCIFQVQAAQISKANEFEQKAAALELQAEQAAEPQRSRLLEFAAWYRDKARQSVRKARAAVDAQGPQIAAIEAKAQPWEERADRYRERVAESPPNWRIEMRNRAFAFVASIFQAIADVYLNQADELRAEMQALRDGADAKDQQAAALDQEAAQLLANAAQARQEAQALRAAAAEDIARAEEAEAKAAEYRRLAANPPETKKTTIYTYGPNGELLGEYDEQGNPIKEYVYLDGKPVAMLEGGKTYYVHNDHLGTPKKLTDENQEVVWEAEAEPFGKTTVNEDPDGDGNKVTCNLRGQGQYYDNETGLLYNWERYLDPETGRYITSDPLGLEAGLNTYSYVFNNPVRYIDPDGQFTLVEAGIGITALGTAYCLSIPSCRAQMEQTTQAIMDEIAQCFEDENEDECEEEIQDCIATCKKARDNKHRMPNVWGGSWWRCMTGCVSFACQDNIDEAKHGEP